MATTVKVAVWPTVTVWLDGCDVIAGAETEDGVVVPVELVVDEVPQLASIVAQARRIIRGLRLARVFNRKLLALPDQPSTSKSARSPTESYLSRHPITIRDSAYFRLKYNEDRVLLKGTVNFAGSCRLI